MAAYLISYRNEDSELLTSKTVFMHSLTRAKSSATSAAYDVTDTIIITISDVGGKLLATKENGKWSDPR